MHIHKFVFVLFAGFAGALLALIQGCGNSHMPMPMGDAGPVLGDSGPTVPDSGPMVDPDAGRAELDAGPAPTVDLGDHDMPAEGIIVAGDSIWHEVAEIRVGPDQELASLCLELDGDPADIARVALVEIGRISRETYFFATDLDGWSGTEMCMELDDHLVTLPLIDADRYLHVWVVAPAVVPNATSGGEHDGFPMSGDRFRIGVTGADRVVDGVRTHVDIDTIWSNRFQIRKSVPMIARQALSSTTLASGLDTDLYQFQVSADAAGPIALHSIAFDVTSARPTAVSLSSFRVRRGSTDLGPASVRVIDDVGTDLGTGTLDFTSSATHRVYVIFDDEQFVAGPGSIYTLHALTGGTVVAGDAISIAFRRTGFGETGYLVEDPAIGAGGAIDTSPWGSPRTELPYLGGFPIWSDLSEVPHSGALGIDGGSRDWTDGHLVDDLSEVSTLTR